MTARRPAALLLAVAALAQAKEAPAPTFASLSGDIGDLVQLSWVTSGLRLDREHWKDPFRARTVEQIRQEIQEEQVARWVAQGVPRPQALEMVGNWGHGRELQPSVLLLFERLQARVGNCSSSSSGMGGGAWEQSFTGNAFSARLEIRGPAGPVRLVFDQEGGKGLLAVQDDGNGAFHLLLVSPAGDLLRITQESTGAFRVAHVGEGEPVSFAAASFSEVFRRHRPYVLGTLLPLLRGVGVRIPWDPSGPEGVRAALVRLRPLSPRDREEAKGWLLQLDDDDFQKREEATQALSDGFLRFRALIEEARKDPGATPEVATRLQGIEDKHAGEGRLEDHFAASGLLENPDYLSALLECVEGADREAVAAALEKVSGVEPGGGK